jgi:hypothetical protein
MGGDLGVPTASVPTAAVGLCAPAGSCVPCCLRPLLSLTPPPAQHSSMKNMNPPHQIVNFHIADALPHIIDVELRQLAYLRRFSAVECHLVVFPYSRLVTTNDIKIMPFQDYAEDINNNQKSTYNRLANSNNKRFGVTLALLVVLIVLYFHPEEFSSAESLVSMFGAYVVGKELWSDLERNIIEWTKKGRLRYTENYYSYGIEKSTTLVQYSGFAMKNRYGEIALHPQKMEYLEQSSSKTVRLWFDREDLEVEGESAHLLSLRLNPQLVDELQKAGYMLGIKLSLNQRTWWGGYRNWEFFQSWSRGECGCLDAHSQWKSNTVFFRRIFSLGRWKFFKANGWKENADMIGFY